MPVPTKPSFSLVLPTYNAASILPQTFPQIADFLLQKHQAGSEAWEVLFVCDGCSDGCDRQLEALAADFNAQAALWPATAYSPPVVRVIKYARNRGKGYAVRLGLLRATGDYRIFADVDLAYRLDQIEALARHLAAGRDVVVASRAHRESEVVQSVAMAGYLRRRKLQSFVFSTIARVLLGIRQRDPQAGLKGLSARAATTVLKHVKCAGFGFDCDLLRACRYLGIPIHEVPIRVVYDAVQSTTTVGSSFKMIRELWRIRRRWNKIRRTGLEDNTLVPLPWTEVAETAPQAVAPAPEGSR